MSLKMPGISGFNFRSDFPSLKSQNYADMNVNSEVFAKHQEAFWE